MIPKFLDRSQLPKRAGVYIFKDRSGEVLYVGKAINLYHRVSSYFSKDILLKTSVMVSKIASLETIIVESELEALILEANLIKKYLPPFNIRLTDDKDYLYIGQTKEDFPKIITLRRQDLKSVSKFWGPFPSGKTVKTTLKSLRRIFPWCSNPPQGSKKGRACFYYHLSLCPGACVGIINKEDYSKIINRFGKFLEGKKDELIKELALEMEQASRNQNFEEAGRIKKIINGILYLTQPNRVSFYLENPNFLEDEKNLALEKLQKNLNLKKLPERIEGFDISNIQGKEAVGSMVVLTNGEIDKSQYRKFKIAISGKPNDVGMHKEMMRRRLKHPEWPIPDLMIIDGGRGQVKGVESEIEKTKYEIPLFGLAKRMEWLYPSTGEIIKLKKSSSALRLLQKLRDESHRFAITYHRKLHRKKVFDRI